MTAPLSDAAVQGLRVPISELVFSDGVMRRCPHSLTPEHADAINACLAELLEGRARLLEVREWSKSKTYGGNEAASFQEGVLRSKQFVLGMLDAPADRTCPDCDTGWPEGRMCSTCHGTRRAPVDRTGEVK